VSREKSHSHGWTKPADLRQQIQRLWDRGELLRGALDDMGLDDASVVSEIHSEEIGTEEIRAGNIGSDNEASTTSTSVTPAPIVFPLRLRLKKPTSRDMGERFSDVRLWIQTIQNLRYTRLELRETRHPQLGRNDVPQSLWIDSLDDAIAFIGRREECRQFCELALQVMGYDTRLINWVRKRPVTVLELASVWDRLLRVHEGILQRQDNEIYLRQLSVAGVDTKFIEAHRGTLAEWLDLALPTGSIDEHHRGSRGFVRRYGFRDKPARLRMRSLDSTQPLIGRASTSACVSAATSVNAGADASACTGSVDANGALATADITLDVDVIRLFDPPHLRVLITENEINYLVLPDRAGTLAVFGSGYGLESLGEIDWLKQRDVWYWGDIDTHGFAILNELRAQLPNVRSLLMDVETLMAHEMLWGCESKPTHRKLEHLTDAEADLYRDLVGGRYGNGVRLEQEQIDYEYMVLRLDAVCT